MSNILSATKYRDSLEGVILMEVAHKQASHLERSHFEP